jgi:hypothetical protein
VPAAPIPIGTFMKNIDLQPKDSVGTPPRITPAVNAAEETAVNILRQRLSCPIGEKIVMTSDNPVADAIAAPTP